FCPMPTWYNLFFTLFAIVALLQFQDSLRLRWIALAGAFTGVSFLFKLVGLYFAAAAALFVIFSEQQRSDAFAARNPTRGCWHLVTIAGLWVYVAIVAGLVATRPRLPELTVLVGPAVVIAAFLSWNEWRLRHHAA